jgi:hypothetical protein
MMTTNLRACTGTFVVLALLVAARPAIAGPPFLCHPFDIGSARSLPWDEKNWWSGRLDYDITKLVDETQTLLQPSTPVIVRMETLRRATLYATRDRAVAARLFAKILERTQTAGGHDQPDGLAWFDAAYLAESFRETDELTYVPQLKSASSLARLAGSADPRELLRRSYSLRADAPGIAFALALLTPRPDRQEFARQARTGAIDDPLLSHNIHLFLD